MKDLSGTGSSYYVFTDHLGTPFAWKEAETGEITYTPFNPWGELLATNPNRGPPHAHGNVPNLDFSVPQLQDQQLPPIGLAGHLYNEQTGLYAMHYRVYSPRLGTFLTPDFRPPNIYDPSSFTQPYAYAAGNPIMYWDPNGLDEKDYSIGQAKQTLEGDPLLGFLWKDIFTFTDTEGSLWEKAKALGVRRIDAVKGAYEQFVDTKNEHGTFTAINRTFNPVWHILEGKDRTEDALKNVAETDPENLTEMQGRAVMSGAQQTVNGVLSTAMVATGVQQGGKSLLRYGSRKSNTPTGNGPRFNLNPETNPKLITTSGKTVPGGVGKNPQVNLATKFEVVPKSVEGRLYRGRALGGVDNIDIGDPRLIVEMPFVGKGSISANAAGFLRDSQAYWQEIMRRYPKAFSPRNRRILNGEIEGVSSPVNDATFRSVFKQYDVKSLRGKTLVHHHIGGGGQAFAIPQPRHPGFGGVHNVEKTLGIWGGDDPIADVLQRLIQNSQ